METSNKKPKALQIQAPVQDAKEAESQSLLTKSLRMNLILIFISCFTVIFLGYSISSTHKENKKIELFIESAKDAKGNFENSLRIYTASTETDINYIHTIRPQGELEIIEFISEIEDIAQKLDLNIELSSLSQNANESNLGYQIEFLGNQNQIQSLLKEIEALPYYIDVTNIVYRDLKSIEEESRDEIRPNITLQLYLYVKK